MASRRLAILAPLAAALAACAYPPSRPAPFEAYPRAALAPAVPATVEAVVTSSSGSGTSILEAATQPIATPAAALRSMPGAWPRRIMRGWNQAAGFETQCER
jgi:hypothetical protein